MAKMVGYACSIRLPWLNKAVQMLEENLPEAEYKEKMNEYLSFEIDSPTRLRKTREILMNVWYYPSEELDATRTEARALLDKYPEQSAAIQYCMLCLTYPVFADVCKIMGKLFEFPHCRMTGSIRKHQSICYEVRIVRCVAKVATVCPITSAVRRCFPNPMIDPFPDEASLQGRVFFKGRKIIGQTPVTVAHRMAVFTHDQRAGIVAIIFCPVYNCINLRIHRADVIG